MESRKKKKRMLSLGVAHLQVTFNNIIVTFTDSQGNTLVSSSAGKNRFKGKKKSSPYAAQIAITKASQAAKEHGVQTISVRIQGPGSQREAALRSIFSQGFVVTQIIDVSALPHNGVKPPKRRRT